MSTLTNYKKEARKLFFISVDKDIKNWSVDYNDNFNSKSYIKIKKQNNQKKQDYTEYTKFSIITEKNELFFNNDNSSIFICKHSILKFSFDFKLYFYILKLKKHIKKTKKDEMFKREIESIQKSLITVSENFVSEIRKEKLTKLS